METIKAKNDLHDFKKFVSKNKDSNVAADLKDKSELEANIA